MISLYSSWSTLTFFDTTHLLNFTMKFLNLPPEAISCLYSIKQFVRHVISDDIVSAVGRNRYAE